MIEIVKEIMASMKQNKLRTGLTGFSVAWGIFMLIILLGSGNGLKNAAYSGFGDQSANIIYIYASRTHDAYKGYNKDRLIRLKYDDIAYLKKNVDNIVDITSRRYTFGDIAYAKDNTYSKVTITGTTPLLLSKLGQDVVKGRFINETDIEQKRKMVILSEYTAETLFNNADPIDKIVTIDNISYKVVGVAETRSPNAAVVYIPITTSLAIYNIVTNREIGNHIVEVKNVENVAQSKAMEQKLREALAVKYSFSPTDKGGVRTSSVIENVMQANMIFNGISVFIWIIGLGTLMAGIVGVSNIMLVTVRERTNEFGIRKSMGATPNSLVRMILIEAVAITMLFGYIGMVGGTFIMEMVNVVMEMAPKSDGRGPSFFLNPTIDIGIAINATIVLVVAGTFAGYIPARRAAKLKTIDAMRYGK